MKKPCPFLVSSFINAAEAKNDFQLERKGIDILSCFFFSVKYSRGGPHCRDLLEKKEALYKREALPKPKHARRPAKLGEGIYTEEELITFVSKNLQACNQSLICTLIRKSHGQ